MEKDPLSIAPGDSTIVITDSAMRNIENMQKRVWDIQRVHGIDSIEARKAEMSFTQMLMTIFRWPGKVFAEDDLSLIINSHITIGIVWHAKRISVDERDPLLGEWSSHS